MKTWKFKVGQEIVHKENIGVRAKITAHVWDGEKEHYCLDWKGHPLSERINTQWFPAEIIEHFYREV